MDTDGCRGQNDPDDAITASSDAIHLDTRTQMVFRVRMTRMMQLQPLLTQYTFGMMKYPLGMTEN